MAPARTKAEKRTCTEGRFDGYECTNARPGSPGTCACLKDPSYRARRKRRGDASGLLGIDGIRLRVLQLHVLVRVLVERLDTTVLLVLQDLARHGVDDHLGRAPGTVQ